MSIKHYVKVQNGQIVEGPFPLSPNQSETPNTDWKEEQMKLHGYFIVDMDYDKFTERLDMGNPIISSDSVIFMRQGLSQIEKDSIENDEQLSHRNAEYPSFSSKVDALWKLAEGDSSLFDALKSKIDAVNAKYPLK